MPSKSVEGWRVESQEKGKGKWKMENGKGKGKGKEKGKGKGKGDYVPTTALAASFIIASNQPWPTSGLSLEELYNPFITGVLESTWDVDACCRTS